MKYLIVGLGNIGEQYVSTRHNSGFIVLDKILDKGEWMESKICNAFINEDKLGKHSIIYVKPATMMNRSGGAVKRFIDKYKVKLGNIVVVHDDIDLSIGKFKIQMNRGSGGHKGVESVIKSLGSKNFVRIRVGVSPLTPSGKIKKPKGEEKVYKHLLGNFKPEEIKILKKISKNISQAIKIIITDGVLLAMNNFN